MRFGFGSGSVLLGWVWCLWFSTAWAGRARWLAGYGLGRPGSLVGWLVRLACRLPPAACRLPPAACRLPPGRPLGL